MLHDFSGKRWYKTKKKFVNLCVNDHGAPLFASMRELPTGDCVVLLSPVLGSWLDQHIFPAVQAKITGTQQLEDRIDWETGMALFTFSPATRSTSPEDLKDPDRMTEDICKAMPKIRQCFMLQNDAEAKPILGRSLGNHFTETKNRLVIVQLRELSLRTWWIIERVLREVRHELDEQAHSSDLSVRRRATAILSSDQALVKAVTDKLPPKLGISNWERVQLYIDVFEEPDYIDDIFELLGVSGDSDIGMQALIMLENCLYANGTPNALSDGEREAVEREYFRGIPSGLKSAEFTRTYGVSRPTHNKRIASALPKLGRCLGHNLEELQP